MNADIVLNYDKFVFVLYQDACCGQLISRLLMLSDDVLKPNDENYDPYVFTVDETRLENNFIADLDLIQDKGIDSHYEEGFFYNTSGINGKYEKLFVCKVNKTRFTKSEHIEDDKNYVFEHTLKNPTKWVLNAIQDNKTIATRGHNAFGAFMMPKLKTLEIDITGIEEKISRWHFQKMPAPENINRYSQNRNDARKFFAGKIQLYEDQHFHFKHHAGYDVPQTRYKILLKEILEGNYVYYCEICDILNINHCKRENFDLLINTYMSYEWKRPNIIHERIRNG